MQIHHINFIVKDLEKAINAIQNLLDTDAILESLPGRDVSTARFQCGELWLVLVSPNHSSSPLGEHLNKKGEGLFLISFGVDDLDQALDALESKEGCHADSQERKGLDNWRVQDVNLGYDFGAVIQLCQAMK